jgi:hypothetical protein
MRNAAAPAVEGIGLDALIPLLRFHEIAVDPRRSVTSSAPAQGG